MINTVAVEFSKGGTVYHYLYKGVAKVGDELRVYSSLFECMSSVTVVKFIEGQDSKATQYAKV